MHMHKVVNIIKSHKEVFTLVALPLAMTFMVAIVYILPTTFKNPSYDFVYLKCSNYCYNNKYQIVDGTITETDLTDTYGTTSRNVQIEELYYYHTDSNTVEKLDDFEALQLVVDDSQKSPDGFRIEKGSSSGGGFLFGSSYNAADRNIYFAINGAARRKLKLESKSYGDIQILGWVIEDGRY